MVDPTGRAHLVWSDEGPLWSRWSQQFGPPLGKNEVTIMAAGRYTFQNLPVNQGGPSWDWYYGAQCLGTKLTERRTSF